MGTHLWSLKSNLQRKVTMGKAANKKTEVAQATTSDRLYAFSDASKYLFASYMKNTSQKLKLIDAYLLYILLTGAIQFVYCCMVGTFPFNAFLSGFISCVASFILGVNLRMQTNPENSQHFDHIIPERAFADFIFAHVLLHLVVVNFIG